MASDLKSPALDPATVEEEQRQPYPPPFETALSGRYRRVLGDNLGLTKFGVNLTRMEPGAVTSLRHWHTEEDEFVFVVSGELTLVTDGGEQVLGAGMAAGFPAGKPDAHRLENRSSATATYLEVGNRSEAEEVHYADVDLHLVKADGGRMRSFRHKDGTEY